MSGVKSPVVALVQARLSSTRLPGKVISDLAGRPLIVFMIERLQHAKRLDQIVVATSEDASDDPLVELLVERGIDHVRGSLHNVLSRYLFAARSTGARTIVRLTADCPLIDPNLVDDVVGALDGHDYSSNIEPRTYPDGLDVEAFTIEALIRADSSADLLADREHVTPWMRNAASGLRRACCVSPLKLGALRWTVDRSEDLDYVRSLVAQVDHPIEADQFDFLRAMWKIDRAVSLQKVG